MIEEGEGFRIGDLVRVTGYQMPARLDGRYGHIVEVVNEGGAWIVVALPARGGEERIRFFPAQLSLVDNIVEALAGLADDRG